MYVFSYTVPPISPQKVQKGQKTHWEVPLLYVLPSHSPALPPSTTASRPHLWKGAGEGLAPTGRYRSITHGVLSKLLSHIQAWNPKAHWKPDNRNPP